MKSQLTKNYIIPMIASSQQAQELCYSKEIQLILCDGDDQLIIDADFTVQWQDWENGKIHNDLWLRMRTVIQEVIKDKNDPEYILFEVKIKKAETVSDDVVRTLK